MKTRTLWLLLLLAVSSHLQAVDIQAAEVKKSVVKIFNETITPDFGYPWQVGAISSDSGSGVIIKGHRILTAAHVVSDSLSLKVRKVGSDKKFTAQVEFISDESDLALLSVDDDTFFEDADFLTLGASPEIGDVVTTWGFPMGGNQLAITQGIVSRIDFDTYSYSGFTNLVAQVDAAINGGASGGPALVEGKISGLNFQGYSTVQNVGYIIPSSVIQQFLTDIKDGEVNGVPDIGLFVQDLVNKQIRKSYGLKEEGGGILIHRLSGLEKSLDFFKEGDVLLAMAGENIANDKTVSYLKADRIDMDYLLRKRQVGESITIKILRDKKIIQFDYSLTYSGQQAVKVPRHYSGFKPAYTVVGGIIFQELSLDYMDYYYEDYDAPAWMIDEAGEYVSNSIDKKDRMVFASQQLPDEINEGYSVSDYFSLEFVNGKPIHSVDDIKMIIENDDTTNISFRFKGNIEIVFDREELKKRDPIIAEKYGIE